MLAAALLGGQVFAAQGTSLSGGTLVGNEYYGTQTETGGAVSGGHVLVSAGTEDFSEVSVYGGDDEGGVPVRGNSVDMTGGEVRMVCGGYANAGSASNNTVAFTGGGTNGIYGGASMQANAACNTVVVTGGSASLIAAGYAPNGNATGNTVNLVGVGATYGDYTGGIISVDNVYPGLAENGQATSTGNALNVFGAGVSVGSINVRSMQRLSFHMTNNLLTVSGAEMLDLTKSYQLDLSNFVVADATSPADLVLSFDAAEAMDWKVGQSVTLVDATSGVKIDEALLNKEYDIKLMGTDTAVAAAMLMVEQGERGSYHQRLKLVCTTVYPDVPEPATGTLGLLALASLAARRRRK